MNEFEQQIENAALQLIGGPIDDQSCMEHDEKLIYFNFKKGAKSDESKAFYQQGMYSESDIVAMIGKLSEWDTLSARWLTKWFERNKKK